VAGFEVQLVITVSKKVKTDQEPTGKPAGAFAGGDGEVEELELELEPESACAEEDFVAAELYMLVLVVQEDVNEP
jgi:hypothetical protein